MVILKMMKYFGYHLKSFAKFEQLSYHFLTNFGYTKYTGSVFSNPVGAVFGGFHGFYSISNKIKARINALDVNGCIPCGILADLQYRVPGFGHADPYYKHSEC